MVMLVIEIHTEIKVLLFFLFRRLSMAATSQEFHAAGFAHIRSFLTPGTRAHASGESNADATLFPAEVEDARANVDRYILNVSPARSPLSPQSCFVSDVSLFAGCSEAASVRGEASDHLVISERHVFTNSVLLRRCTTT